MGPITEAHLKIREAYVPGCVKFYSNFPDDPWWKANVEFADEIQKGDLVLTAIAANKYSRTLIALIEVFKKTGIQATTISEYDAFIMGDEEKINSWHSRKSKSCMHCGIKENLKIVLINNDVRNVGIVCKECDQK